MFSINCKKRYVLLLMKVSHHCPPCKSFPCSLMQSLISPDESVLTLLWRTISISYKKKTSPEGVPPLFTIVQSFPPSLMQSLIFRVAGLALLPRQGCRVPIRLWWVCKTNRLGSNSPSFLFSAGQTRSLQGSVPIKKLFHKGWFPSFPCLKLDM